MAAVKERALWQDVLAEVERAVGSGAIETWLRDVALIDADREQVVIAVPTQFARQRIEGRFRDSLALAFEALLGARPSIRVEVDPSLGGTAGDADRRNEGAKPDRAVEPPAPAGKTRWPDGAEGEGFAAVSAERDDMTVETFIVGPSNRVAFRAAERVCEWPGEEMNPLVVIGAEGVGKTHLLSVIARSLRARAPDQDVLFVTAEDFANQFRAGIRTRQTERFRERYRRADAIIIDDLHLLCGKQKTQIEFLHTFEELLNAQKQIVVSSQESPKRLEKLHPGLASRLLAGLVAEIDPPDLETRRRIVHVLAGRHRISLTREVMDFVARNLTRNVRDLVGAIQRLQAHAAIGERVDVPLARRRLGDLLGPKNAVPPEELLVQIVAERCAVPPDHIRGGSRKKPIARARQVAMFLARRLTRLSLTEIGRFFRREPSTVTFAEAKVTRLIVADDAMNRLVEECQEIFKDRC